MSNEEIQAIIHLNKRYKFMSENPLATNVFTSLDVHNLGTILNYIEKLQIQVKESEKALVREREFKNKEIDKLQKENDSLKEENSKLIFGKFREVANKNSYVSYRYISIDEIKEIIGYGKDEEVTKETIMSLLETMWEENNRLEDIEDRKVEVEYKNVFNKGVISVKDKIRNEIKELENILEKRKTIDIIEEINRLEELLGDD